MSDIHAALGRSQLARIDVNLARRAEIAGIYSSEWKGMPIELPVAVRAHAWHLYVVRVDASRRAAFRTALRARGVDTQIHYRPIYEHPLYHHAAERYPVTAREAPRILSLPMWPMPDEMVETVVAAVKAACAETL